MTSKWQALAELGQSVWYDNVARPALDSGLLAQLMAEDDVTGGTSNPSIFANAVRLRPLRRRHRRGARRRQRRSRSSSARRSPTSTRACDLMRPVWERTGGRDGFISLEVEADLAFDEDAHRPPRPRAARARRPPEPDGEGAGHRGRRRRVPAADPRRRLRSTSRCSSRSARYREIADAYVDGARAARSTPAAPLGHIASVASFFVSRIDTKVDKLLPEGSPLRGRIAVANAKLAYADVFEQVVRGPALGAAGGGRRQRAAPALGLDVARRTRPTRRRSTSTS